MSVRPPQARDPTPGALAPSAPDRSDRKELAAARRTSAGLGEQLERSREAEARARSEGAAAAAAAAELEGARAREERARAQLREAEGFLARERESAARRLRDAEGARQALQRRADAAEEAVRQKDEEVGWSPRPGVGSYEH